MVFELLDSFFRLQYYLLAISLEVLTKILIGDNRKNLFQTVIIKAFLNKSFIKKFINL